MASILQTHLSDLTVPTETALDHLSKAEIIERIWDKDHTVWSPDPTEISNRMGWMDSPNVMNHNLPEIDEVVVAVRNAGFTQALLLGMGGSSLAPELFRKIFGLEKNSKISRTNIIKSKICSGIQKSYLENHTSILKLFKIKNPNFSTQFSEF